MNQKLRLDDLVAQKFNISKTRARSYIMAGKVMIGKDRQLAVKPGIKYLEDTVLALKEIQSHVSRAAEKLIPALDLFKVEVRDRLCLDIGISTGGFTEVLLQRGASKVYGVDVGYGQVAESIRQDKRVVLFERTNFRYFDCEKPEFNLIDIITCDVSFISPVLFIKQFSFLTKSDTIVLILLKPQFLAGADKVGTGGIVRDMSVRHRAVIETAIKLKEGGLVMTNIMISPLKGTKGNMEYFDCFRAENTKSNGRSIVNQLPVLLTEIEVG